ncbi:hypothetical protein OVA03_13485 [Asticcacaulis sp. SL142]|uniref:hypothetical protein n=1 Tax=Asticcacaulis sp. SL142 TaxID=2995155 RepID=UPI00226D1814|nr:hypothetical protein [Asticcacaulis sp. SL142]WAC47708.1 hypothetical protein OVA03_13485 [Asticcacaulis sp. SL142]
MNDERREKLTEDMEQLGESGVRKKLTAGYYGEDKRPYVKAWLEEIENDRLNEREHENTLHLKDQASASQKSNRIAMQALQKAENANKIAIVCVCVTLLGLLISALK